MDELYKELAEYVGRDLELVKQRCQYAAYELAWQWHVRRSDLDFYRDTDLYLYDLTKYQQGMKDHGHHEALKRLIKEHGWKTVLDYGGGTGEWAIAAAEAGCDVYYLDVLRSKTADFASWRFDERKLTVVLIGEDSNWHEWVGNGSYDLIIAMDVLEHLPDPDSLVKEFAQSSPWLMANPSEIRYNIWFPQHISHYDLTKLYEHKGWYLWKTKEGCGPRVSASSTG